MRKVEEQKKIHYVNTKQKEAVDILISDKIDFIVRNTTRNK